MPSRPLYDLIRVEDEATLIDRAQRLGLHAGAAGAGLGGIVALFEPFGIKVDTLGWTGMAGVGAASLLYGVGVQLASRMMTYHRVFVAARALNASAPQGPNIELIRSFDDIQRALRETVEEAEETFATTGSRSRDVAYMKAIENK